MTTQPDGVTTPHTDSTSARDSSPAPSDTPVAVVGLGTMGAGIAEVFARAGHPVRGIEADDAGLDRGREILATSTERAVAKGKLTADERTALLDRFSFHTDPAALAGCSVVIEAVSESLPLKQRIFTAIDEHADADALVATNTSSLSITTIAAGTGRADRVIGLHFFNPAPVQKLVEVVTTVSTDATVIDRAATLLGAVGKTPIRCTDRAGFIVNALLVPYLNRAAKLYGEGFATAEELDGVMVEQAGNPMGPLTLLDLVGLDVTLAVVERLWDESRAGVHAPAPLLRRLVAAGRLGRKTGRGLYGYGPYADEGPLRPPLAGAVAGRADELPGALVAPYLNDAIRMVQVGYATAADIDTGMSLGCRMPRPFDVLAELSPGVVLETQRRVFAETAEPHHRPAPLLEQLAQRPALLDTVRTGEA